MFYSTKVIELGSCAFRQWRATHSHCQYLHGYQLKAKFWFQCSELDEKNWCVDFGGLKSLKEDLQGVFDHKLWVAADDPALPLFKQLEQQGACQLVVVPSVGIERAAEYCFKEASEFISLKYGSRCKVLRVEVFEHENNSALYEATTSTDLPVTLGDQTINAATPILNTVVDKPVEVIAEIVNPIAANIPPTRQGAHVGPNTTSGKSGWFSGTSWS